MTHKNRKKCRIFMFLSTGCSLLRAEGFSCSLGVLYEGLGISKLQFFIKKIEVKFPANIFFKFQVIKPWIQIRDPYPESGIRIRNQKKCWIWIRIRIRIKSMRIRNPGKEFTSLSSLQNQENPDPFVRGIDTSADLDPDPKCHGSAMSPYYMVFCRSQTHVRCGIVQ